MTSVLSNNSVIVLEDTREYVRHHVDNPRFREYILLALDEASEGNMWRFEQCQNLKWMPVDNTIHSRPVKNRDALANPEALELFQDLTELQS